MDIWASLQFSWRITVLRQIYSPSFTNHWTCTMIMMKVVKQTNKTVIRKMHIRSMSAMNMSVFAAVTGWPRTSLKPSQEFSGLAKTTGEITWQAKHNRLTRYANTYRLSFNKPLSFTDYLLDSGIVALTSEALSEAVNLVARVFSL